MPQTETRSNLLNNIVDDIENIRSSIEKLGYSVPEFNFSVDSETKSLRLNLVLLNGIEENEYLKLMFLKYHESFGLDVSYLNQKFIHEGLQYEVLGIDDPRDPNKCLRVEREDGMKFNISPNDCRKKMILK